MSILFLVSGASALGLMPLVEAAPPRSCSLSGTVELLAPDGARRDPRKALVYVRTAIDDQTPPKHHEMLQVGYEFEPRLLMIKRGDFVDFLNKDTVPHEVHANQFVNGFRLEKENAKDTTHSQEFKNVGVSVIGCHRHGNMRAVVVTVPNAFNSMVDEKGKWFIDGLGPTKVEVVFWVEGREEERLELTPCVDKPRLVSLVVPQPPSSHGSARYKGTE